MDITGKLVQSTYTIEYAYKNSDSTAEIWAATKAEIEEFFTVTGIDSPTRMSSIVEDVDRAYFILDSLDAQLVLRQWINFIL
jgi:hypothetical protein